MKIMVFDVPAESGGALSVLHEFYNEFKHDKENEYVFVISLPELKDDSNLKVLRFPWIKKSWFHRLYFDHIVAPKLIKEYEVDQVLSLQNLIIPHTKVYQSVLVHNALPFSDYKISLDESKLLWVYQNIIAKSIKKSIIKANNVIVQTKWMKKIIIEQLRVDPRKIEIKQAKVNLKVNSYFNESSGNCSKFFYPASGVIFKNHKVIVDACIILNNIGIKDYLVSLTLSGKENKNIRELSGLVEKYDLPIQFVGTLSKEEVFNLYTGSVLLFPSLIETVGLPLIEAKMFNAPIIVADYEFSREVLEGYSKAVFFNSRNSIELAKIMLEYIEEYNKSGTVHS